MACAPIEVWNRRMGRWVNANAKGIALIDESGPHLRLRYIFDVSDTRPGRDRAEPTRTWRMEPRYEDAALEALDRALGAPDGEAVSFTERVITVSRLAVRDGLPE